MNFLNLALLGGLAAVAIPIIIHLFHKSRFQIVKWGAMHLLEAVIRQNQRRVRIEQLILLAIRCAIPLLLALAMARPIWKGAQKLLGDTKSSTVLLLDDSYSMDAGRTGISNFSIARDETSRLFGDLKRGSEVQIVRMGGGGRSLLDEPTYDTARAAQALNGVAAAANPATIPSALDLAGNVLSQMREPARGVVVMTDFQRVSFDPTEDKLVGQMLERLKAQPVPPTVTFFDIGQEVKDNVAIESLEFSKLMLGVGQKLQIRAQLRNFGEANYPALRVYLRADGKEKSASSIRLGPGEKGQVLFTTSFDTAGSHVIEVQADADPLKADNIYLAAIPVRDRVPVLLINGEPSPEPLKGETDFAEIALQPFATGKVELADLLQTKTIRPEELTAKLLAEHAVVLMANVRKFSDEQTRALDDFVKTGGGLLIFPGGKVDTAWYHSALLRDGKGPLPLALGPIAGDLKDGAPNVAVAQQRFDNAALELFNDPRNGSIADASVKMWFRLQEPPASSGSSPATALARLETGDVFLAEKPYGEGRVILCATALDADWGNLPTRPSYLPLLQRLNVYLASTIFPPRNLEPGKPLAAFLPVELAGKKAALARPDGTQAEIEIVKRGARGVVEYARTEQPGLYTLTPPGAAPLHYAINADRRESSLARLNESETRDFAKSHGVDVVRSMDEFRALEKTRRFGREIWKWLLFGLLALSFVEILLQQKFSGIRRKPTAPTP